ncbi:hypothetical protein Rhe02_75000 [Rhizocola hellebori]|uniref:F5/8 type C domain-containing protein n=1 Tax=Rhizocola hellebori TaxID=1392758 RepID=A0A8J3VKU7_9ACTN|nr:discoidin domain-containing protein [Rhizocola hellebori]GIH09433.1 hypothetical protein Rhe02_75000 [Rhizocola hellebori]
MARYRIFAIYSVLALLSAGLVVADPSPAMADYTTTVVNFNTAGNQVTRYDTEGNAVDAHDGDLALFGETYYLYGTSYDCGYTLTTAGTKFCGFKVYSSPDLVHWTDRGQLFEASGALWQGRCAPPQYGCYRPHVVYNQSTSKYVLWINGYDNASGYHVFTSDFPTGPFAELAAPTLAVQGTGAGFNNGDMDVFVDDDLAKTAYLAYTDIRGGHDQIVEKLNASYTSGTGQYTRLNINSTEAPSLFKRGLIYYHLSGPNCPYCTGTATQYRYAGGPLGPWSAPTTINTNSCGGQPSFVSAIPTASGTTYLYGSDLWNGEFNEALANYHWAPLTFAGNGSISSFSCLASVSIALTTGSAGSQIVPADRDQADGVDGFRHWCDIHSTGFRRMQTFVASRTGTLTSASYTSFRKGNPNAGLTFSIVAVNASLQPVGTPLFTTTVPADAVGWSPRNVTVRPHIPVTAGIRYGIQVQSTTTAGCYGLTYNDTAPYPGGGEAYSTNGTTYIAETNRSSKFETTIGAPNFAAVATSTASSSVEAWGWGRVKAHDGQRITSPSAAGWSTDSNLGADHPEWILLDLGTSRLVQRVDLYPRNDPGNVGQGFPKALKIEVSVDAVTWTEVRNETGLGLPSAAVQSFPFATGHNARYIRVTGTSLRNSNPNDASYRLQLAEVEVY